MFTKNLKDQFSADLLNTVRSILGEAKHDKECECKKCEEEDEEEDENGKEKMKEGFASAAQRKAVWATYADGGKGHPDKKKKMKKEEVELEEGKMKELVTKHMDAGHDYDAAMKKAKKDLEKMKEEADQIDELSKATMGRYINRAKDQIDSASYRQGHRDSRGDGGNNPVSRGIERKLSKRHGGIELAVKKLTKEESEQIDELSKGTLGSYVKKAAGHAAGSAAASAAIASSSNPKVPQKVKRDLRNRMTGISKATDKLTKEEQEFIDSLNNEMFEEIEIAEANLKVGDYTATSEKSKFHKKGYRPHLKNPQGKTSYLAGVAYKTPEHAAGEAAAYHKGYTSGPGRASERGADDAVRAYRHKNKEHMHEETEQIDELSKDTLKKYKKAATADFYDADAVDDGRRVGQRYRGIKMAQRKLKKEEAEAWHVKLNGKRVSRHFDSEDHAKRFAEYGKSTQKGKFTVHKSVAEEVELEEGRGRPPKEGSAAWHAKQKQADDDMVALGMQLRKAKSINKKVRFMDGKEHDIHPNHINRFDDHMAARRTSQEKAAFQKQAHKSHADFVKAVSAPVPKSSKDTGEIVKYR